MTGCPWGPANLDRYSFKWNLEANQELESEAFANMAAAVFEKDCGQSQELDRVRWPQRAWVDRLQERFAGWLDRCWIGGGGRICRGWRRAAARLHVGLRCRAVRAAGRSRVCRTWRARCGPSARPMPMPPAAAMLCQGGEGLAADHASDCAADQLTGRQNPDLAPLAQRLGAGCISHAVSHDQCANSSAAASVATPTSSGL